MLVPILQAGRLPTGSPVLGRCGPIGVDSEVLSDFFLNPSLVSVTTYPLRPLFRKPSEKREIISWTCISRNLHIRRCGEPRGRR